MKRKFSVLFQNFLNKLNEVDKVRLNELFRKVDHITKWIESCQLVEQIESCERVVENLYASYPKNQYIFKYLRYRIRKRKLNLTQYV